MSTKTKILAFLVFASMFSSCRSRCGEGYFNIPRNQSAVSYPGHVELNWDYYNGAEYSIYRKSGNHFSKVGETDRSPYLDFSIGHSDKSREFSYLVCPKGARPENLPDSLILNVTVTEANDTLLLETIQKYTTRYFTDFAEPNSGLSRERSNDRNGDIVTIGGSGFGLMALIAADERGYVDDEEAVSQYNRILNFLETAERFHGAWSHWYDADTRKPFSFSKYDDGGDLVETSFMAQALITLRQYLKDKEPELSQLADKLWKGIDWQWYTKDNSDSLYWHWSKNYGWKMNHRITGYDECFITYVLAASSPTHPIRPEVYNACYKNSSYYYNGKEYYGIPLTIGMEYGGPLFFTHYSFLGLDPRGLHDELTDYGERGRNHALIQCRYAIDNPKHHAGYGEDLWGFTSSDDPFLGYCTHQLGTDEENGTVSPTAAVSSIVYTPEESFKCIRHLYYDLGAEVFGPMGFYDAYNPSMVEGEQVIKSYLAIDQGPIAVMIENYRSGLLWNLFMSAPEISVGLDKLGLELTNN